MYIELRNVELDKYKNVIENGTVVLKQDEDITLKKYILYIYNPDYKAVYALKRNKQTAFNIEEEPFFGEEHFDPITGAAYDVHPNRFYINIDFDNPIESILIEYNNKNETLEIPVIYQPASKEAYYAKLKEKQYQEDLKKIDIKVSTGDGLVNVYFKPLNDKYMRSEVYLYTGVAKYQERGYMETTFAIRKPIGGTVDQLIAKYEVPFNQNYYSIDKLASRTYAIRVVQYNKKNEELIASEYHYFNI